MIAPEAPAVRSGGLGDELQALGLRRDPSKMDGSRRGVGGVDVSDPPGEPLAVSAGQLLAAEDVGVRSESLPCTSCREETCSANPCQAAETSTPFSSTRLTPFMISRSAISAAAGPLGNQPIDSGLCSLINSSSCLRTARVAPGGHHTDPHPAVLDDRGRRKMAWEPVGRSPGW